MATTSEVKEKRCYLTPTEKARGPRGMRGFWTLSEKIGRGIKGYANVTSGA